jgi:preprotein translocase subunit SecD
MRRGVTLLIPLALAACAVQLPKPPVANEQLSIGTSQILRSDIVSAKVGFSANGDAVVDVRLSPAGAVQFEALTRAYLGKEMPIRIGGDVLSRPHVVEPIINGLFQISGAMTVREAQILAKRIGGQ